MCHQFGLILVRGRGSTVRLQRLCRILLIALVAVAASATADSLVPALPADGEVSVEQIETAIRAVEARDGFDDQTRAAVIDQLRDAQSQIGFRLAARVSADALADALNSAPAETRRLRTQLETQAALAPTAETLGIRLDMALNELEQALTRESTELATIETRLAELETQIVVQSERPASVAQRIDEIQRIGDELTAIIDTEPPPGELVTVTDARRLNAMLTRDARAAELHQLEQELLSHDVRIELLRAKRDVAAREATFQRRRVEFLQGIVNSNRQFTVEQAQLEAAEAELAAADLPPDVRAIAEENAALTRELPAVVADTERVARKLGEIRSQAQEIERNLLRSRQRLEIGGVTQAIGRLLVEERRALPNVAQYRAEVRSRRTTLSTIGLAQVRIEEQRHELTQREELVEQTMLEVSAEISDPLELESIRSEITRLLRDRREVLDQAASSYTSYLRALSDLDIAQRRLLENSTEYREYLDRNLLWIPGASVIGVHTIADIGPALQWALSPKAWAESISVLTRSLRSNVVGSVLTLLLLLALVLSRRPLVAQYRQINSKVGRLSTDYIGLTLAALVISAIRVLPIPLILALLGWGLQQSTATNDLGVSLSYAMLATAPYLYNLLLFRAVCAEDGVARLHFGWDDANLGKFRRQLDRLIVIGTPLVFLGTLAYESPIAAHRDSLGRAGFIAFMMLLAVAVRPLCDPRNSVSASLLRQALG